MSASSRSSSAYSASEPILPTGAGNLPPLLYVCVVCEGALRAERAVPEVALVMMALRGLALKAERGLQRGISFASKEERLPRGSRCGADAMRLPAAIMAHVLRRHGHAFCVLTTPDLEAEFASRCCEQVCSLYSAEMGVREPPARDELDEPPVLSPLPGGGNGSGASSAAASSVGSTSSLSSAGSRASSARWSVFTRRARRDDADLATLDMASFPAKLEQLLREQNSPERLARVRRVTAVQDATREVASVLEESIDRVLATGQNLEELEDKSEWLLAQATTFRRVAREQRRLQCCKSLKMTMIIGLPLCVLLAVGVLLVLHYTGVWQWPWVHGPAPPPPPPSPHALLPPPSPPAA